MPKILKTNALIFDMDGVITNTMPDHYKAWKKVMREEGLELTHEDVYLREGQPGNVALKELCAEYDRPYVKKHADNILKRKEEYFKKIVKLRFVAGARAFIRHHDAQKFPMALVTGTSRHEMLKLLPKHIQDHFSVIVTGSDVKHGKPHPEPFLRAIKSLKVDAAKSYVIENAPFGIRSSKSAGIKCIALETSLGSKYLKDADYVFKNFLELNNKIQFRMI